MGRYLVVVVAYLCTSLAFAQTPLSVEVLEKKAAEVKVAPAPPVVPAAQPVVAPAAPVVAPVVKTVEEVKLTVKDEALVPPVWLQDAVVSAKSLPWIGPLLVKSLQWLGMIVSILTALFAFLWAVLRSLQVVASASSLVGFAEKLAMMENSKFMYYLKAFSAFNAQKKDKPA